MAFSKADRLLQQYKTIYENDDDDSVEFVGGEYANKWDVLVKVLVDQREEVNADVGLSTKVKKVREVQLGAKSDLYGSS